MNDRKKNPGRFHSENLRYDICLPKSKIEQSHSIYKK